jgi:fructose-1,6-bisphosphatase/inositol monophosphatase family enzyme
MQNLSQQQLDGDAAQALEDARCQLSQQQQAECVALDLDHAMCVAVGAAVAAGNIVNACLQPGAMSAISDKTSTDPVTEADKECERLVLDMLTRAFPSCQVLGEEMSGGDGQLTDAATWVVDPIDGTANFVHSNPYCCISIGLVVRRESVLGVVYHPATRDMYSCIRGRGAFLNGRRLCVSSVESMERALIITEMGSQRSEDWIRHKESAMSAVINLKPQAIRCFGAAALNLCQVAAGRAEAYFEHGPYAWDLAAASLLCSEAGACVTDMRGAKLDLCARNVLVVVPKLQPLLLHALKDVPAPAS